MKLDGPNSIDSCSQEAVRSLSELVRFSEGAEQFIYREAELDDLWRICDMALRAAREGNYPPVEIDRLSRLRQLVREAHDLLGQESDPLAAAARLQVACGDL